ncbi:MAG TPA: SDR family NAD(P)-dependent oxidoreductase [Acidimicrobiales bacterium]|nr:SDR family NAD(P)-dependent oxidoreductase [Acidimicrobiales bacterium]
MSQPTLAGKVALITGGASGQGRAAALLFAAAGAEVAVADINTVGANETVKLVEDGGGAALAIEADVARRADNESMIDATVERFGRLDVLYNNAAVQMSGHLLECRDEDWDVTMATNLDAVFFACRAAIPRMIDGGGGSIINTASVLGLIGSAGYCAYGAAKAGLVALTRQIAVEYGPHVRANVIAPGSIDTPRFRRVADDMGIARDDFLEMLHRNIPLHRLGTADDVAGIALFLASDQSAYVTGAVIPADGGLAALR